MTELRVLLKTKPDMGLRIGSLLGRFAQGPGEMVTENIRRMGNIQPNCPLWGYCSHGELGLAANEDGFRDVMIYHLLSP